MYYKAFSRDILKLIKSSNKIILNAHRNPDLDSIGSSTVMFNVLKSMGKKVEIVCPHQVPDEYFFIKGAENIRQIDFKSFDFAPYDLFIIMDSGSYDVVTDSKEIQLPKIPKIVIDHHRSNNFTDVKIKLLDEDVNATCEIIYKLLYDWNVNIDKDLATALFSGISGDTVFFRYTKNTNNIYQIINDLLNKGADKDLLLEKMYNNYDFESIKLVGEFLRNMKMENTINNKFVWSAVNYDTFKTLGEPKGIRELAANLFFQSIKGVDLGLVFLEQEPGNIYISFRTKNNVDASKLAKVIGGGGHLNAAGAKAKGEFRTTIVKVIKKIIKTNF